MKFKILVCCASLACLTCSGDNNGDPGPDLTGDEVADILRRLNIDTTETPRVDQDGEALPDSYAPLGRMKTLEKKVEFLLAGPGLTGTDDVVSVLKFRPGVSGVPGVPESQDRIETLPSAPLDTAWKSSPFNAAAAGDIDGDGVEELVLVYFDVTTDTVKLKTVDDQAEGFTESEESVLASADPSFLRLLVADFDGDGTDDIAVAIVEDSAGQITVSFLSGDKSTGYSVGQETTASLGFTTGSTVIFSGTVGDSPAGSFDLDKAYAYGMFVYLQERGGQEFQVINYWVQ